MDLALLENLSYEEKVRLLKLLEEQAKSSSAVRLAPFIAAMRPDFCFGRHHEIMFEHFEAVEAGDITRLMIFMPPRSSKSLTTSTLFPAWCVGRHPTWQFLSVSYDITQAEDFSRSVKNIVASEEFSKIFPECAIAPDARAAGRWWTTKGGKYYAAGIKSGVAGKGANLGIIDDPLNEQDAFSKAAREHTHNWYPGGFRSRLMPDGRVVVASTRWHEEDLPGWLEKQSHKSEKRERWTILKIPALLDNKAAMMLGYAPGTSYWPPHPNPPPTSELTGWSTEYLEQTKEELPSYQWEALYMQSPTVEGGNIIKREYWMEWEEDEAPDCYYVFMSLDTAFSKETTADFSVIQTWGVFDKKISTPEGDEKTVPALMLLGARAGRWEFPRLKQEVARTFEDGPNSPDMILIEAKGSGQSLIQDLRIAGYPVQEFDPKDKDKIQRAHAATTLFHSRRVYIPKRPWAEQVVDQCAAFPRGQHDDHVDACTQAVLWVRYGMVVGASTDREWDDDTGEWFKPRRRRHIY